MIDEIMQKVELHRKRVEYARREMDTWEALTPEMFDDFEKVKTIDTFIYRFIKMQDMMGDKLFKVFLDEIGEYKDSMSLLDMLDKLEKFEIIDDASDWMRLRKLRNQLTHEYPNNEDEIIEGIELAKKAFSKMETILESLRHYRQ